MKHNLYIRKIIFVSRIVVSRMTITDEMANFFLNMFKKIRNEYSELFHAIALSMPSMMPDLSDRLCGIRV